MRQSMIDDLKDDYLQWTGGFTPDTDNEISVYLESARPADTDPGEARSILRRWMNDANEPNEGCWIIEWRERTGCPDHDIKEVARTAQGAIEAIKRFLNGEIIVDESLIGSDGDHPPGPEQPAFDVLFEGESPIVVLQELKEELRQETEHGTLIVTRASACRQTRKDEQQNAGWVAAEHLPCRPNLILDASRPRPC